MPSLEILYKAGEAERARLIRESFRSSAKKLGGLKLEEEFAVRSVGSRAARDVLLPSCEDCRNPNDTLFADPTLLDTSSHDNGLGEGELDAPVESESSRRD